MGGHAVLLIGVPALEGWIRERTAFYDASFLSADPRFAHAHITILAPCPHNQACPLVAPDWCHFSQRLARSRDHRLAKGAEAPFEDEKFSYLVVARPGIQVLAPTARVLAPPHMAKPGIDLKLCSLDGRAEAAFVPRRDKPAYAIARRLGWGDALPGE